MAKAQVQAKGAGGGGRWQVEAQGCKGQGYSL